MFFTLFTKAYRKIFLQSLLLSIFDISAYWFTYSWLPGYLFQERQLSMAKSAIWIMVTQTGGFLGYLLFGLVADWIGRRPAYSVYCGVRAVGLVMITLFWDTIVIYPPLILTFMFLVGLGSGSYGGYGPLFTELFDTSIRNTAMGSAFNLARGIQFFTPVIIAVIAKQYGLGGAYSWRLFFSLLTGIWIWTFPETKGRRLAVTEQEIGPNPKEAGQYERRHLENLIKKGSRGAAYLSVFYQLSGSFERRESSPERLVILRD